MEAIYRTYMQEQYIEENGLSARKCAWKGCYARALNGKAFCPGHFH